MVLRNFLSSENAAWFIPFDALPLLRPNPEFPLPVSEVNVYALPPLDLAVLTPEKELPRALASSPCWKKLLLPLGVSRPAISLKAVSFITPASGSMKDSASRFWDRTWGISLGK